jgi:hypothetical protein
LSATTPLVAQALPLQQDLAAEHSEVLAAAVTAAAFFRAQQDLVSEVLLAATVVACVLASLLHPTTLHSVWPVSTE